MSLSRPKIVAAARAILDAYGLADLSMRRVADALGVQAGALYHHVPNKQSMLSAISDDVLAALTEPTSLAGWAHDYRRVLLGCRDGAELVASSRALGLGEVDPTLLAQRFVGPDHHEVTTVIEHYVLGATMQDQTRAQMAGLGVIDHFDAEAADATFARGVELIVDGAGITIERMA